MGSNLHKFDVRVEFGPDGEVAKVFYEDAEGCGFEQAVPMHETVYDLVHFHLNHYRRGHDMAPQPLCDEWVALPYDGGVLRCTLDAEVPHDDHVFTWRKR